MPPTWIAGATWLHGTGERLACASVDFIEVIDEWGEPQKRIVDGIIDEVRALVTNEEFVYWAELGNAVRRRLSPAKRLEDAR